MKLINKNILVKIFLILILVLFLVYNLYYIYNSYIVEKSWQLSDWLINYQDGGFKRRGLGGSFFFLLQDITRIPLENLVFYFVAILQILFFYFFYLLSKNKVNIGVLTLLLSPLVFGFWLVDKESVDRKEILLFVIFTSFAYFTSVKQNKFVINIIIPISIFIGTFIHEFFIFFISYFLVMLYLQKDRNIYRYILYFLSALVPAVLIYFFGGVINEGQSLNIILKRGLSLKNDGIFVLDRNFKFELAREDFFKLYGKYFISILLGIFYFFMYVKIYLLNNKKIIPLITFSLLYSVPLFYMAGDWGRWLNIHFTLILIIFISLTSEKNKVNDKIFYYLFPTIFLWGFNVLGDGFHFYTKFNIVVSKILNYLF